MPSVLSGNTGPSLACGLGPHLITARDDALSGLKEVDRS